MFASYVSFRREGKKGIGNLLSGFVDPKKEFTFRFLPIPATVELPAYAIIYQSA